MSARAPATLRALGGLASPLRRISLAGWVGAGVGVLALALALPAWIARLRTPESTAWVLVAWGLALVSVVLLLFLARRARAWVPAAWVARRLEADGTWRHGTLTAVLEPAAPGTSPALWDAADRRWASELAEQAAALGQGLAARFRLSALRGAALAVVGLGLLAATGPFHGPASALWRPVRAWEATVAPVRLRAEATEVDRGARVRLALEAFGRRHAVLWLRAPGEPWRTQSVALDTAGRAGVSVGPLQSDLFARLTSGGRSSDTLRIAVRIPAFLGMLILTAHYPRYLGLDDEPLPSTGDTLLLPAGTRVEAHGLATAPLRSAGWTLGLHRAPLAVRANGFAGEFTPWVSGTYRLAVTAASGAPLAGDSVALPLRVVPDSAPRVDVPVPGADTVAPLSLQVPLVIDARDDHGLHAVWLESRRISRLGFSDPERSETVPLPPGEPDRTILTFQLDLNRRGLLPGDSVRYRVRAVDNSPAGQAAVSREYVLRLATLSELREAARVASGQIGGRLDSIADRSRRLERQTEDLSREQPREGARPGNTEESLRYESAQRAENVAKAQETMLREVQELKQALEALRQSAEAAGLNDPEWQKQLAEIQDQIQRALSPELREKLAELQQALKDLDADRAKEALERLAEAQQRMREALERSRELFRRAALEGDLANLAAEARQLTQEQAQWNDRAATADSARAVAEQADLASRTDSLAGALGRVGEQLAPEGRQAKLAAAADQARQAAGQMRQAGRQAQQGNRSESKRKGEQAEKTLEPVGDQLEQERDSLQTEWRQEVVQAIDRALTETTRITQRQLEVADSFRRGADPSATRVRQGALEEGVQRLLDQLKQASGKNALVSPSAAGALSAAALQMQRAREAVSNPNPNAREAGDRAAAAVDALNVATYDLLRNRGDVSGSGSGSGLAEAMERMSQLAQQQGGLSQQGAGLLPQLGTGAMQLELGRLGARQRALAEQLERLRAGGNMPGAGELADEAKSLARQLEAGRIDRQTVERQERLFRRMLDAGRTLQGSEEDQEKERQSMTASGDSVFLPPALRARLEADPSAPVMPTWEELQRFSPEERRLVVEYFRRLSRLPR